MKYVGFCYDSKAWGGDLTALLLVEIEGGGWAQAASHISSTEQWARRDIAVHYDHREDKLPDDTYEWVGLLSIEAAVARFTPAPEAP